MDTPQKLIIEPPFDPEIPIFVIYPKSQIVSPKYIWTLILIVALFTIAILWKQLISRTDEWIMEIYTYIHTYVHSEILHE